MKIDDHRIAPTINPHGVAGIGEHLLRYRLRAEVPGIFHALPTKFYAIYVPELKANSYEHVMKIVD